MVRLAPPPSGSSEAFVSALKTYKAGDTNAKASRCFGFRFQPVSELLVSALGWGTQNALSLDKTCTMWRVSDKAKLIVVTLQQGTQPVDGWVVGEAPQPYEQLDPNEEYRLVCCVAKNDGDLYNRHKADFVRSQMENSTMITISDPVSGKAAGKFPNKLVGRVNGAPTFFTGSVPVISGSLSASDLLFSAGYSAAIPVTMATVVEQEEPAITSDICLCSAPQVRALVVVLLLLCSRLWTLHWNS